MTGFHCLSTRVVETGLKAFIRRAVSVCLSVRPSVCLVLLFGLFAVCADFRRFHNRFIVHDRHHLPGRRVRRRRTKSGRCTCYSLVVADRSRRRRYFSLLCRPQKRGDNVSYLYKLNTFCTISTWNEFLNRPRNIMFHFHVILNELAAYCCPRFLLPLWLSLSVECIA